MSDIRTQVISGVFLLMVALSFQTSAQAPLSDADKAAIKQASDEALVIGLKQDWAAYANFYYADDVVLSPPNTPALKGHEDLIAFFKTFPPLSNVKFVHQEVDGFGDLAYVWGVYSYDILLPGAESPAHETGTFVELWRKQKDGAWRVTHDMFNSDN